MKPILFNTEMVSAILDSTKTVTRRVIKFDTAYPNAVRPVKNPVGLMTASKIIRPPYQVGDILYVRETFALYDCKKDCPALKHKDFPKCNGENTEFYIYATDGCVQSPCGVWEMPYKWTPSIHMPKEAARIFLRVTNVYVERLQDSFFKSGSTIFVLLMEGVDIGEQCRECIDTYGNPCCIDDESECGTLDEVRSDYSDLWNSTVKKSDLDKYGWDANPWVTVNEFRKISKEEALNESIRINECSC